ncbi:MAG: hypothetical protein OEZ06_30880, partial [Myxococcales bacterium]|nr:hypothetical protein [Myxococcales bacterium]
PDALRPALHRIIKAAYRRKALKPQSLPFGMVAMDGKATSIPGCDDDFAQPGSGSDDGLVRTITRCARRKSRTPLTRSGRPWRCCQCSTYLRERLRLAPCHGRPALRHGRARAGPAHPYGASRSSSGYGFGAVTAR